jgi:small-conductance mechanosensitive channel
MAINKPYNLLLPFFLCLLIFTAGEVQAYTEAVVQDSTRKKIISRPLSLSDIPVFGQQTRQLIIDARNLRKSRSALPPISEGFVKTEIELKRKIQLLSDTLEIFRFDRIRKEERELNQIQNRLDNWQLVLDKWSSTAISKESDIKNYIGIWILTEDSLASISAIAEEFLSRDTIIDAVGGLDRLMVSVSDYKNALQEENIKLQEYLGVLLAVKGDLAVTYDLLDQNYSLIEEKKQTVASNIFLPDNPPIWLITSSQSSRPGLHFFREEVRSDIVIIHRFFENHPHADFILMTIFLTVLALLIFLRLKGKAYFQLQRTEVDYSSVILDHIVAVALVITWFVFYLFYDVPREVNQFFALVCLLPMSWLLKKIRPQWTWGTVAIFILVTFTYLFLPVTNYRPMWQRIILLLLSSGVFVLFAWLRQRTQMIQNANKRWMGLLPFLLWAFSLLNVAAVIANIVGSVQLAYLLVMSTIGAFIGFIAIGLMIDLLQSMIFLLLLGPLLKGSYIIQHDSTIVLKKLNRLFRWLEIIIWTYAVLDLFAIRDQLFSKVMAVVTYPLVIGEMKISLGNVLAFYAILQISIWLSQFIRYFLDREVFARVETEKGMHGTVSLILKYTITIVGFFLALSAAGLQLDKLSIVMGALGVGIGFGLQNIVNNLISGMILAAERPIHIGDMIEIPGVSGRVKDIGLRATVIGTWDGADVVVPNGDLLSSKLTNWMLTNMQRRVTTEIRVPFDSNINEVSSILLETASSLPEVLKDPEPYLNFTGMGTSAMEIKLYCWISRADEFISKGRNIRIAVYAALQEAGYKIPPPRQEISLNSKVDQNETGGPTGQHS